MLLLRKCRQEPVRAIETGRESPCRAESQPKRNFWASSGGTGWSLLSGLTPFPEKCAARASDGRQGETKGT